MAFRRVIWSSADKTITAAQVQKLQYIVNSYLSIKNKVEIIMITDDWWALVGTDQSKKTLDKVMSAAAAPRVDFIAE